jgi:hypothetical protein
MQPCGATCKELYTRQCPSGAAGPYTPILVGQRAETTLMWNCETFKVQVLRTSEANYIPRVQTGPVWFLFVG